jgi:hypothetical protein
MAQESSPAQTKVWTKIFTTFKVALDVKKLILAAVGILLVAVGWWFIGWTFYGMRTFPEWKNYEDKERNEPKDRQAQWAYFKSKRASWNLLHELAGYPWDHKKQDAADVTNDLEEYLLLRKWEEAYLRMSEPITLSVKDRTLTIDKADNLKLTVTPIGEDSEVKFANLASKTLTVTALSSMDLKDGKEADAPKWMMMKLDGVLVKVEGAVEKLKKYRDEAMDLAEVQRKAGEEPNQKLAQQALKTFNAYLVNPKYKPSGKLRIMPWWESRGENPYLLVAATVKTPEDTAAAPGNLLTWLFSEKSLVLVEPLVKFLTPLVYLFDVRAGFWDRLYLIFVIVWTLAVWGFFGGAICRIAAVQIARNERISLAEAIAFTRERFVSYLAAPVFPMVLLAFFVVILILFGWIQWIPWLGDLWGGALWPVVLLIGFMMAIVMVGLIGWPLMIATISTEGTDSFDALSRSYSYVYQAPWQYLWYNFLAVVYGAVLVFFIGFMASLFVFLGKWGVGSAPGLARSDPEKDREPSYLFDYAPTSYGWRDLLISSSPFTESLPDVSPEGKPIARLDFTPEYRRSITGMNAFGAGLVAVWIWPLFLLVLGFGYSYFWSASTMIYLLMRRYVDDTEMDEVHQEDDDLEDPFLKSTTAPSLNSAPPAPSKPGTVSLNVVEGPPPAPTPAPPPMEPAAPTETPAPPAPGDHA